MITSRYRVAYFVSHPIQYQAPMLRYINDHSDIDIEVFFMSDFSVRGYRDEGFGGITVKWDVPLLEGYKHEFLPVWGKRGAVSSLSPFCHSVFSRLRAGRFDAVWCHGWAQVTTLQAILAARLLKIPVLLRADTQRGNAFRRPATRAIKEKALRTIFSWASGLLAVGSRNREYYLYYGVPENKIYHVPYAVDNDFFQQKVALAKPNRDTLRAELGLSADRPVILYVSKLNAQKRAHDVLEAYIRLSKNDSTEPEPYLLFVGDGVGKAEIEARASATGWSSVKFLGFKNQSELPPLFDLCDVFVLASEREAWGLVVNEVMNAGKPVIITEGVGAAPDLVRDGVNGFVTPVGDIACLADRLRRITSDATLRDKMGAASLEIISEWDFRADVAGLTAALCAVTGRGETATS